MDFCTAEEAIEEIRNGHFLVVVDSEDRENEGDLIISSQFASPEAINFLETEARGWICCAMEGTRLDELHIPLMVRDNTSRLSTAFTVTVDAKHGTSTGISASDQARTIQTLIDPKTQSSDLLRPGHVQPLRAMKGGVLVRAGHTEAAVDLSRLAGLFPCSLLCEIKKNDGEMARLPELKVFAEKHNIKLFSIA
ncbi:MAG: 3,4-dihydroxy-2-butanone-4-phosphate synthase [SAR324 cluster bacterium]|uniref:3,4-dihydroxy-2-butanone 4-phosphate synthase n=1 Tax=SAR324 cluster bacterium TaxID=2024889 RepID=A0A7X9FPQ3_9DELT|nr:3,4-dihydroxy-2-butanone-4-phosphate synthase [SAR324 cluster bacterium]